MNSYKLLSKLSQNLLEILDDEEYYDITIEVGNDPHKKNDGTLTHIKLPNISAETFLIILKYIYNGKLPLKEYDILDIIKILTAASELNLEELISYIQLFLIKNETKWMEQNFNLIYQMSFNNDSFLDLQKFCTELISKQPEKVFNSTDFALIPEKALISLIQHDNLQFSEVQVWEYVLKWGIAQYPELSSDPSNYSSNDFNALKNTLQQFIPLIKFTEFTPKEFLDKVFPYRKVIPEELNESFIKYFLDYNSHSNKTPEPRTIIRRVRGIDSKIITQQHAEIISKWVDRLEIMDKLKNSYKFNLIHRGSRDGFTSNRFHDLCGSSSNTITVIKVKGSNEILGGYSPIEWKGKFLYGYGITNDSFIFSFNNDNIEDCILSRVKDEKFATYINFEYGPSFGYSDLIIYEYINLLKIKEEFSYCYCIKSSYEKPIRKTKSFFSVEEYEVFQITKD
ncbi:carbohydrate-binding module family 13 protein [Rhizophagus clarus]|uniref:Carbohydrate-binding module family 13 protein n=1 Tax=Rhizophagus clarus TaxID=94130 RepID=A0A8H3LDE5_9GLOM|nr:carbohydrate-binding module family 13 protein [Rhizophagus clarus]